MATERVTWWLYHGGEPVYAVRGPQDADAQWVRSEALGQHDRVPLCYPEAPYSFRHRLLCSEVRR